jgi:tripartite-type tricarboxylate transporter receptor subunit TctC
VPLRIPPLGIPRLQESSFACKVASCHLFIPLGSTPIRSMQIGEFVRLTALRYCLLAILVGACVHSAAQTYPTKPVRVIAPFAPGGGTDIVARLLSQKLSGQLGQQFIVDNKAGAGGNIGAELAAKSTADGYTLMITGTSIATAPGLYKNPGYDPIKSFEVVSILTVSPYILVTASSTPLRTVADVLATGRGGSKQFFGTAGSGTAGHLAMELLKSLSKADLEAVHYKGGSAHITALLSGEVQFGFENVVSALPFIKSGRLRAIATSGANRVASLPEVPTVAESGYPGFDVPVWTILVAPTGVPRNVVDSLHTAVKASLQDPDVKKRFSELSMEPVNTTPTQAEAFLRDEVTRWTKVIREAKLQAE